MRLVLTVVAGVACTAAVVAAGDAKPPAPEKRYGVEADLTAYPQATPKEALASVVKAVEDRRLDYLVAQLTDPDFVDRRVKDTGGDFAGLVKEATARLVDDPGPARQLQRLLKDGAWDAKDDRASVHVKDVRDRWCYFRKADGRWFLENRYKPDEEAK
jgi:hypothetical protein